MIDAAVAMRARSLIRRHILATVALGLFAGLAGGAAIGAWGIARRTGSAYDRFIAYEDAATYNVMACPNGFELDPVEPDFEPCRTADQIDILEAVRRIPGVESAGRWTFALAGIAREGSPDDWASVLVPFPLDAGALPSMGRPIVVAGRLADQDIATEIVINEELATLGGVGVGDRVVVTVASADEFERAGEAWERPTGTSTTMDIVGIVRRPGDLTVGRVGENGSIVDSLARVEATRAWSTVLGDDFARYGIGVVVRSDTVAADDVVSAIEARWPGRMVEAESGSPTIATDPASVLDAIDLQSLGMLLLAIVVGFASLVFAGQAISRQVRSEWADSETLAALGMTGQGMITAALVRALAIAAIAGVMAAGVVIGVSPLGPAGVARKAEPFPGVSIDPAVLTLGTSLVVLAVLLFATVPVAMLRRRRSSAIAGSRAAGSSASLSPSFGAGWAMTRSRRGGGLAIGSAVAGVALAAATGVAAWELTTSYDDLVASPVSYGAEWDALVGNVSTADQKRDTEQRLAAIPGIRAMQILSLSGTEPNPDFTITSAASVVGEMTFGTVTDGRPPMTSDEVALGMQTIRELDVGIGDSVVLPPDGGEISQEFEVVGEVIVNDGFEARPGTGALVTPEAFAMIAPGGDASTYAVWVDDDAARGPTLEAVRQAFPTTYVEPRPSDKIANLRVVAGQPKLLALVVAFLAGAAMVHTLAMSVRRSHRQIGVLKALGFTRPQVIASVGWHATTIAGAALVVGVPLGIIGGRLAWTTISSSIGIPPEHSLPIAAVVAVVLLVLIVANIAALVPGVVAARTRSATALRAE